MEADYLMWSEVVRLKSLEFIPSAGPINWNNWKSVCVRACVYVVHAN